MNRLGRDADGDDPSEGPGSDKKGDDSPSQNINPQAFPWAFKLPSVPVVAPLSFPSEEVEPEAEAELELAPEPVGRNFSFVRVIW